MVSFNRASLQLTTGDKLISIHAAKCIMSFLYFKLKNRIVLFFKNAQIQENDNTSEQDVKLTEWADKLITVGSTANRFFGGDFSQTT